MEYINYREKVESRERTRENRRIKKGAIKSVRVLLPKPLR